MSRLSQKPVRAGESALQWRFFSTKEYGWSAYRLSDCMIEINLWAFYVIGYRIHRVADPCFPLLENSEMWSILNDAKTTVKDLCEHNPLQFSRETRDAMTALQEKIDDCLALFTSATPILRRAVLLMEDENRALSYVISLIHSTSTAAQAFENELSHECPKLSTFFVPQKGTHQTASLMQTATRNLSASLVIRLSKDAKDDINAAGRCLALDSPTAAGFHILRAVEALMREYYFKLTGTHLKVKSRNWGTIIKGLDKHGADPKVTGFLTHIKDFYRNVIIHPEATYTSDEAFALFSACLSVITMLDAAIHP